MRLDTSGNSDSVLDVHDLYTYIKLRHTLIRAVEGVSLNVKAGETVGLVGESGCGKSIMALSVMRLLPRGGYIAEGSIRLAGRDVVHLSEREMRRVRGTAVALVSQDPMTSLNPTMTIGNQIAEAVLLHRGGSRRDAMKRAEEVLGMVRVPRARERLGAYPHQLSGGLRQRVMIAIALSCEPLLLIADEPTTALDVTTQAQILRLLEDIRQQMGMGILFITHDLGVVAECADRVCVMYAGKLVEEAPVYSIYDRAHHPYTAALLGSIPKVDQDSSNPLPTIPGQPPDLARELAGCRFAERCGYAESRCRETEPPLTELESEHWCACLHPLAVDTPATSQPSEAGPAR